MSADDPSCWYAGEPGVYYRVMAQPGHEPGEIILKVMGDPLVMHVADARAFAARLLKAADDVDAGKLTPQR